MNLSRVPFLFFHFLFVYNDYGFERASVDPAFAAHFFVIFGGSKKLVQIFNPLESVGNYTFFPFVSIGVCIRATVMFFDKWA